MDFDNTFLSKKECMYKRAKKIDKGMPSMLHGQTKVS
jgi:hypothetical protein